MIDPPSNKKRGRKSSGKGPKQARDLSPPGVDLNSSDGVEKAQFVEGNRVLNMQVSGGNTETGDYESEVDYEDDIYEDEDVHFKSQETNKSSRSRSR